MTTTSKTIYATIKQYTAAPIDDSGRRIVSGSLTPPDSMPEDLIGSGILGEDYRYSVEEMQPSPYLSSLLEYGTVALSSLGNLGVVDQSGKWIIHDDAGAMLSCFDPKDDRESIRYWTRVANTTRKLTQSDWEYLRAASTMANSEDPE